MNLYLALGLAAIASFLIAFGLGYVVIPFLHKLSFGQTILDIGPKWHKDKQGTPIMGGIMFIVSTLIAFGGIALIDHLCGGKIIVVNDIVSSSMKVKIFGGIIMALGFAFIGFLDDYIKAVKKRNMGLSIKQKSVLQIVVMLGYLLTLYIDNPTGAMFFPFIGMVETKIFFWVIGIAVIYCTTNAVNFTDGVDGLCASVTAAAAACFIVVAGLRNCFGASLLSAALMGGLVGYVIWNWHPAKVMMGDLGSMFLGGMIVALAYAVDCPFIILLIGIIYVAEFGSDIIQIGYFKMTHGKRFFKMAPIHHHFELCGWKETKIVKIFTLVTFIGGALAIALFYFGNLK